MTNLVNTANKPKAVIPSKFQMAVKIVAVSTPEPRGVISGDGKVRLTPLNYGSMLRGGLFSYGIRMQ